MRIDKEISTFHEANSVVVAWTFERALAHLRLLRNIVTTMDAGINSQ